MANVFENQTFLFTGKLENMTRAEAEEQVEELGGKIVSSVSKNLSVLVSTSETSAKWKKAQELNSNGANIQLWTEEQFMEKLEEANECEDDEDDEDDEFVTLELTFSKYSTAEFWFRGFNKEEDSDDLEEIMNAFENGDSEKLYDFLDDRHQEADYCPLPSKDPIEVYWKKIKPNGKILAEGTVKINGEYIEDMDGEDDDGHDYEVGGEYFDEFVDEEFDELDDGINDDCYLLLSLNEIKWSAPYFENIPADINVKNVLSYIDFIDSDDPLVKELGVTDGISTHRIGFDGDEYDAENLGMHESAVGCQYALLKYHNGKWKAVYILDGSELKKGDECTRQNDDDDEDEYEDDDE